MKTPAKLQKLKKAKNILPFILSILSAAFGFGFNYVLAKYLGSAVFGDLQYLVSIATTFSSFFVFGLSWFVVREAKNPIHNGELMNKVFTIFFLIVAYVAPILFYILYNYTTDIKGDLSTTIFIILVALVMAINTLGSSYFQGVGKYYDSIIIENIIPKFIIFLLTIVFLWMGTLQQFSDNYLAYYLLVYGLIAVYLIKRYFKRLSFTLTKKEYISITFFFGVTITYSLTTELTKVFQGAFFNDSSVLGIISISLTILNLLTVITGVVTKLIQPVFAKLKRENNLDGLIDVYRMSTRVCLYVCIPFYIFLFTQGENFLLFFGESYTLYPMIIVILALRHAMSELSGPTGTMLSMTGKEKIELINGIINIGTFVVFCFAFSYDVVYGLCVSLLLSTTIVNIVKYIEVWVIFKRMPLNFKTFLGMFVVCAVNFAAIFFLQYIQNYWLWFSISAIVGVALICLNFVIGLHPKDFKKLMRVDN